MSEKSSWFTLFMMASDLMVAEAEGGTVFVAGGF